MSYLKSELCVLVVSSDGTVGGSAENVRYDLEVVE